MRFKALLLSLMATAFLAAGCTEEDDVQMPYMDVNLANLQLDFSEVASSQTFTITANRSWKVTCNEPWISVEPASGSASDEPQTIKISVLGNDLFNRTASVKVSMDYDYRTVTVNQKGEWGNPEDLIIYKNNFDKAPATQTYGTGGKSWPFTDQSDCWNNETGSSKDAITYTINAVTVRNNSNSNGNYSDYEGSGVNNLFFGQKAGFKVENINVVGRDFTLTFGSEKYLAQGSSVFDPTEFHVWLGPDPQHMIELAYSFPNGFKDGRWDLATTTFTVPEGINTLCLYFKVDVASAYRLDDVNLSRSITAGTPVDFSEGVDPDKDPVIGTVIYFNNFDKETATQTYGSKGNSWPFTDQSDCWRNETGEGVDEVAYFNTGISVRANSASDGSYSDYPGSGVNNLFFASKNRLKIKKIKTKAEYLNYRISFGAEKYVSSGSSLFDPKEFHVYIGKDTLLWTELTYAFAGGEYKTGRWDEASVTVTIPTGVSELFFWITADAASAYRLDDFKVTVSEEAGTAIDFSQGKKLDPDDPTPGGKIQYKKVSSVTSGKAYLLVANNSGSLFAAAAIPANKTYGYPAKVEVTAENDVISLDSDENEIVLTKVTNTSSNLFMQGVVSNPEYTMKQKDGRYLYQSGTYNSMNVDAAPNSGQYWTITVQNDGTFEIKNSSVNKWWQYSTGHSSWGSYASAQSDGLMPYLYERQDGGSGGGGAGGTVEWTVGSGNQNWAAETNATYGAGFAASDNDMKVGYYKHTGSSAAVAPSTDHIRVYKNSVLVITPTGGKKVKKVEIETTTSSYAYNMVILSPGSGTATKEGTKITWEGTSSVTPFVAHATAGQVRVKKLTVTLE